MKPGPVTQKDLDSIVILYRRPNSMGLVGIPYAMREDVGQTPRHIEQASRWYWGQDLDTRPRNYAKPAMDPERGWLCLGWPGWWGFMKREEQQLITAWLATLKAVPGHPAEFLYVKDFKLR